MAVFTAVYFYAGMFGLSLVFAKESVSAVWPPTGIALAATLIWGYRFWPAIFIGSFLVNNATNCAWVTSLGVATGDTLEALVAAGLLRKFANGLNCFDQPRTTFKFFLFAPLFSTMLSATLGVISLGYLHHPNWQHVGMIWSTWWIGDMTSDLVIAPFLIIWLTTRWPKWQIRWALEGAALAFTLALVGWMVFIGTSRFEAVQQLEYLTFLPLLWAVFRFGAPGATVSVFVLSGFSVWSTLHHQGPFAFADGNVSLLLMQSFNGSIALFSLICIAVIIEHAKFETRLIIQDAVSRIIAESAEPAETHPKILQSVCELAGWDFGALWQLDKKSNQLRCSVAWSSPALKSAEFETVARRMCFDAGVGLPGLVWSKGEPVWIKDVTCDSRFTRTAAAMESGLHSAVGFPIKCDGSIHGVMEFYRREIQEPEDDFRQMLVSLGRQLEEYIERKKTEDRNLQLNRIREILLGVDTAILHNSDRQNLLDEVCRVAVETGGFKLAWVGVITKDGLVRPVAQAGVTGYVEKLVAGISADKPEGRGAVGMAIRENRPVVIEDISGDSRMTPWHQRAQEFGLKYVAAFPLRVTGKVAGVFTVYAGQIEYFAEEEINLLTQVSHEVSYALTAIASLTAHQQAEEQLRKLSHAVAQSPASIVITDTTGAIEYVNPKFTSLTGYTADEVLGKNPRFLKSGELPDGEYKNLWQTIKGGGEWRGRFHNRKKNGDLFWEAAAISPVKDAAGKITHFIAVKEDITEFKKMETRLLELAAIVQSSEDAIISASPDLIISSWNRGAEKLFGYEAGEVIGKHVSFFIPPGQIQTFNSLSSKLIHGEPVDVYETVRRHKDGSLREVSVKVSAVLNESNQIILFSAIYRDITAQKEMEKTVLEISALERRRVGHDLHDGLGQHLAGLAFKAKVLEQDLAAQPSPLAKDAEKIVGLINEAILQTRHLAAGFDPVDIEVGGLPAALQQLAQKTTSLYPVSCTFKCNRESLELDKQVNLAIFRITQESINNAIRHGQARRIEISLQAMEAKTCLTIRDNGKGFLLDGKKHHGMGLGIMSYRANSLGGKLTIHSELNSGTEINCSFGFSARNKFASSQED
ncbi:MAG TPA: PAS domain S-box protein [Candidatus Sulfotelmatobacter sp.]|nr:PAS domain S-box protein [Candidatus Sulfotelmatobacter sp.]